MYLSSLGFWGQSIFRLPKNGGETGIRTLEAITDSPVFKTGAFNHSAISPIARFRELSG
jgi:hypothetical protein